MLIGLALHQSVVPPLIDLCKVTPEGIFIESPEIVDIEMAFQAITELIFGVNPDVIIESFE